MALCALVCLWAPSGAGAARLRGLDSAVDTLIGGGQGRLLAGNTVVAAVFDRVYSWPVTGGPPHRIARLPHRLAGLFAHVEAAQPGRIVVAAGSGVPALQIFDPPTGHTLGVGPPAGPFGDPGGCGETTGPPATLDGNRLAYVADVNPQPCPSGSPPPVTRRSIVVRDLAAGGAVQTVVPLPRRQALVSRIALAGPYLAYAGARLPRAGAFPSDRERLVAIDLRSGATLLDLPPARGLRWALAADGIVVAGHATRHAPPPCGARIPDLRRYVLGGVQGVPVPAHPCGAGGLALHGGRLRLSAQRPSGRETTVDLDLATGHRTRLAITSGPALDGDARHLVLIDDTCTTNDLRVAALHPGHVIHPAGARRCPIHAGRAHRTARRRVRVRLHCPAGCRVAVGGPDLLVRPHRARTVVVHTRRRRIGIRVHEPVGRDRVIHRRVR